MSVPSLLLTMLGSTVPMRPPLAVLVLVLQRTELGWRRHWSTTLSCLSRLKHHWPTLSAMRTGS